MWWCPDRQLRKRATNRQLRLLRAENGGKRTDVEKIQFDHQLKHANLLYLGCNVLVLVDFGYLGRFWFVPPLPCS